MSKKTTGGAAMIDSHPINLVRSQDIEESFAFLEHHFLLRGLWAGPLSSGPVAFKKLKNNVTE
jgi:hypothetical protein